MKYPLLPKNSYNQSELLKDEHGKIIYKTVNGWKQYAKRKADKLFNNVSLFVCDQKEADLLGYNFVFVRISYANNQKLQG